MAIAKVGWILDRDNCTYLYQTILRQLGTLREKNIRYLSLGWVEGRYYSPPLPVESGRAAFSHTITSQVNQRFEPTGLAPAVSPPQGAGNEPKEIQPKEIMWLGLTMFGVLFPLNTQRPI